MENLIDEQKNSNKLPNFVCITEHWLKEHELEALKINNYEIVASCHRNVSNGGGTLILSSNLNKENLKERLDFKTFNIEKNFECCAIEVVCKKDPIIIACIYRSPSGDIDDFFMKLDICMEKLINENKNFILAGDFNIDLFVENENCKSFLNMVKSYGAKFAVREATRITNQSSTLIDNFITNMTNFGVSVSPCNFSDHELINLSFNNEVLKTTRTDVFLKRAKKADNLSKLRTMLRNEDWLAVLEARTVNDKFNNFLDVFLGSLNASCPIIKSKRSKYNKPDWITSGINKSTQTMRDLRFLAKISNNIDLKRKLKNFSKLYNKVIEASKRQCVAARVRSAKGNSKTLWRIIKDEMGTSGKSNTLNEIVTEDDLTLKEPQLIVNTFNDYFLNIMSHIKPDSNFSINSDFNLNTFFLHEVEQSEVRTVIDSLKNKTTQDIFHISNDIIKSCSDLILIPITDIISCMISTFKFPDRAKFARIIPLKKVKNNNVINNFRPISCLPVFSKIFEKFINGRIDSFLNKYNIISQHQFGYVTGKGVNEALFNLTDAVLKYLNIHEHVVMIALDQSKAFDCVDHSLLLRKLYKIGFRGGASDLLSDYLNNRFQRVEMSSNGLFYNSDWNKITKGVPQGSILGPKLFQLFINDLPAFIMNFKNLKCDVFLYADDITLIVHDLDEMVLGDMVEYALSSVNDWCKANGLSLNLSKTQIQKFKINNKSELDVIPGLTKSVKFLGITFDYNVKWKAHIDLLCAKLNKVCYQLRVMKKRVDVNSLLLIYYTNFCSIMSFGIIIWGSNCYAKKVLILQKKVLKIIFGLKKVDSCKPIFKNKKILTFHGLYVLEMIKFIIKNKNYFLENRVISNRPTRQKHDYLPPYCGYKCVDFGPRNQAIKIYNKFMNCKIINNIMVKDGSNFVTAVKKYLLDSCPYSMDEVFFS